ncbi:MAG: hypothetical protein ACTHN0_07355 [Aquihabitans sp.]
MIRIGRAVAAGAAAVLLLTMPSPVRAAEAPVLTATPDHVPASTDATIVVTLTGCDGPGTPAIEVLRSIYDVEPQWRMLPVTETSPGVWEASSIASSPGSDQVYRGVCSSGATSPDTRVDVDWKEMFTVPFLQPTTAAPLLGVTGTDCETGDPSVQYRVDDRFWIDHVPTDEHGDFRSSPPTIGPGHYIGIMGSCGGTFAYGPIGWFTSEDAVFPKSIQVLASAGEGPPGTSYVFDEVCDSTLGVSARQQGGEAPPAYTAGPSKPGWWQIRATAAETDTTFDLTCGRLEDPVRFDVDAPTMAFASSDQAAGPAPDQVVATDCPPDTAADVRFLIDGDAQDATAVPDLSGDWTMPLPAVPAGAELVVEASCGSVTYDPITLAGTSGEAAAPGAAAPAAAPASAVPGQASYTG